MATVAISTSASPSQQAGGPPATQKQPRSRMFRSISRFLSGGTNKQRPKQQTADLPQAASNNDEPVREQARAEPRRTSSSSRSGSDTEEEEEERHRGGNHDDSRSTEGEELSTRAVRRFPRNDSVSRYSAVSGADTEASLYAMASTRPGSSLHTVDSSSHASSVAPSGHASTHKSYASTKPTTLLSVDSLGGANRIAVVPGTGAGNNHAAAPGGASTGLSFASVLPSTPPQSSPLANAAAGPSGHRRGTSASSSSSFNSYDPAAMDPGIAFSIAPDSPSSGTSGPSADRRHDGVNVPNFSHPHPRNNPHPAYPAQDNASILTLASSSFAPSFIGSTGGESKTRTNSWGGGGLGGLHAWSSKQQARSLGGGGGGGARSLMTPDGVNSSGGGGGVAADEDASVRALPGSRRASNESLGSRSTWSAAPKDATPSVRSRPFDDELAAAGAGAGRAASTSPSKKERRTSMRTVETAPSVRSVTTTDRREMDDGSSSIHHDDAASATEEGGAPAVNIDETVAVGDTTVARHRPALLSPRRADSDLATTASAAESFRTAPEAAADDERTSIASSTQGAAAHPGEKELAPPVPDIEQGSPDHDAPSSTM